MNKNEQVVGVCGLFCKTCPHYVEKECDGCLSDRVYDVCRGCQHHGFMDCAKEHGVVRCADCAAFPCRRLKDFRDIHVVNGISHHEHILEYVARQRAIGAAAWAEEQGKEHACPACGAMIVWYEDTCRQCGKKV